MKTKTRISMIVLMGFLGWESALADDTVMIQCPPPTHRVINNDCDQQGALLTQAEIDSIIYTFFYGVKGTEEPLMNVDVTKPIVQITFPGYGVEYEITVGARIPGGTIYCISEALEYKTELDKFPPGPPSAFTIYKE